MSPHRLALFSPWFGRWPEWINLHLESCRRNPKVTWFVPTDQEPPKNQPPNVRFLPMTMAQFVARAEQTTGHHLTPENAYKLCDYRPLLGEMFFDDITDFTHFGYADNDVIFGQLDCELSQNRLETYDIISGHGDMQAGHLSVLKNTSRIRSAWRRTPKWKSKVLPPSHFAFDEGRFGRHLNPYKWHPPWRRYKVLWHEMHSMPDRAPVWLDGGPNPTEFHWKNGILTEPRCAKPQYAYLHFMLWRDRRHRHGTPAPWEALLSVMKIAWRDAAEKGFVISHNGFTL
ncbi:DUF6625 family protein [Shimia sp.]|uniref:DUF6625 family protein n=1 Tax=Shimia sp. TaxID=1954381 RepID=UPI0032967FE1